MSIDKINIKPPRTTIAVKVRFPVELYARMKAIASLERKRLTTQDGWIVDAAEAKVWQYRFSTDITK